MNAKTNPTYLRRMKKMAAAHRRHALAADHDRRQGISLRDRIAPPPAQSVIGHRGLAIVRHQPVAVVPVAGFVPRVLAAE